MIYGHESKCVGKFRPYSIQSTSNHTFMDHSQGSKLQRFSVEGLICITIILNERSLYEWGQLRTTF